MCCCSLSLKSTFLYTRLIHGCDLRSARRRDTHLRACTPPPPTQAQKCLEFPPETECPLSSCRARQKGVSMQVPTAHTDRQQGSGSGRGSREWIYARLVLCPFRVTILAESPSRGGGMAPAVYAVCCMVGERDRFGGRGGCLQRSSGLRVRPRQIELETLTWVSDDYVTKCGALMPSSTGFPNRERSLPGLVMVGVAADSRALSATESLGLALGRQPMIATMVVVLVLVAMMVMLLTLLLLSFLLSWLVWLCWRLSCGAYQKEVPYSSVFGAQP